MRGIARCNGTVLDQGWTVGALAVGSQRLQHGQGRGGGKSVARSAGNSTAQKADSQLSWGTVKNWHRGKGRASERGDRHL